MSYTNFNSVVWSAGVERQAERNCVFAQLATSKFDGDIKKGGRVKIKGTGSIDVYDYKGKLKDRARIENTSVYLDINEKDAFNVEVGDIDLMIKENDTEDAKKAIAESFSEVRDRKIAKKLLKDMGELNSKNSLTISSNKKVTSASARTILRKGKTLIKNNKVNAEICVVASCEFVERLELGIIADSTDNQNLIEYGFSGKVHKMKVYEVDEVISDDTYDYVYIFTKNRCFAHGHTVDEMIPYVPEDGFEDSIKGLSCHGTKLFRPKEFVVVKIPKSSYDTLDDILQDKETSET